MKKISLIGAGGRCLWPCLAGNGKIAPEIADHRVKLPQREAESFGYLCRHCRSCSGWSRSVLTTLNTAVFAPMPSASVMAATKVQPFCLPRVRHA